MIRRIHFPARPRSRGWGAEGDMWYQDVNGIWQSVSRPSDWADIPYFLGLDQITGYPIWLALPGLSPIIRGAFISSTLELYPPEISRVIELAAIASGVILYAPFIQPGDVAVTGSHIAATTQLFAPSIELPGWGWSPLDVSGLVFWFAADRGVTHDGTAFKRVLTIDDQSANAFSLTQENGGGGPQEVRDDVTAGIEEIFHFPGGANWARMRFDQTDPFNGLTAAHLFWGVRFTNDPSASPAETGLWNLSPQGGDFHSLFWTDGIFYDGIGANTRHTVGNPSVDMTSYRVIDIQNQSGATGYKFHIDSSLLGEFTGDGTSWNTGQPTLFHDDRNFPTGVVSFNGRWHDIFMYDHVLTGSDLTAARDFVQARFDGSWLAAGGDG